MTSSLNVVKVLNIILNLSFRFFNLERKIPDEEYRKIIPDLEEYTKEPPSLPPHLRHIILNKVRMNALKLSSFRSSL